MKKIIIWLQIIAVIVIVLLVLYNQFKPVPAPDYTPSRWRSWDGFLAISFSGISNKKGKGNINRKKLYEELTALKKAGYKTISPKDIVNFLNKKHALPKKAIFIMFEEDRKESYLYAKDMLNNLGFLATMAVPTTLIKKGGVYLKESELKKLVKDPHWFLASMGDRAIIGVQIDSKGTIDHFLSHRAFLKDRLESDIEFRARIIKDYSLAQSFLTKINGTSVETYLYPYSDPGTGRNADPIAEELNIRAVKKFYKIAFVNSNNPLNGPSSNPYTLTRLRIPHTWDVKKFITELNNFLPRKQIEKEIPEDNLWIKNGIIKRAGYLLYPKSNLWLKGSDTWSDIRLSLKLTLLPGANFIIFTRYTSKDSFFSVGLDNRFIYVREKIKDSYQTLLRKPITSSEKNFHNLKIVLKGKRAMIWDNGEPISKPIPISSITSRGRIGFLAQKAPVKLLDFEANKLNELFVFSDNYQSLPQQIKEKVSTIIPLWYSDKTVSIINKPDSSSKNNINYNIFIGLYNKSIEADAVINYLERYWFKPKKHELFDKAGNKMTEVYLGPFDDINIAKLKYDKLKKMGYEIQLKKATEIKKHNNLKTDDNFIMKKAYFIDIGKYKSLKHSQKTYKLLKDSGFSVNLKKINDKIFKTRILLGPYANKISAKKIINLLQKDKGIKGKLIKSEIKQRKEDFNTNKRDKFIQNSLGSYPISLKIGNYTNSINSSAIYDLLKNSDFPVYEREYYINETNKITEIFVGPYTDVSSIKNAISVLKKMGFTPSITMILLDETKKLNLLKAAAAGIRTSPIIKINIRLNKQAAEHLVNSILEELNPPAVKLLLTSFTIYGLNSELHDAFHKFGFRLIRIITPEMAIQFAKKKQKLYNDFLLIKGDEIMIKRALSLLLKSVPKENIIVDAKLKGKAFIGIKRFISVK
jgi:cell division septation protein DedD